MIGGNQMKKMEELLRRLECDPDEIIYQLSNWDVAAVMTEVFMHDNINQKNLTDKELEDVYHEAVRCLSTQDEFPGYLPLYYGTREGLSERNNHE